ncbi:MAG: NIPSNAP family protein [Chloroflexi bacterium]|nr:NIPSNAP family protein [Chloroflexota bacterium]
MLYELRIYEAMPGNLGAVSARFENHTTRFFARHGITAIGFWTTLVGPASNEFTYLLAYENMADREKKWNAFAGDPEWLAVKRETEKDGPIVANIRNQFLAPTPYSPLK